MKNYKVEVLDKIIEGGDIVRRINNQYVVICDKVLLIDGHREILACGRIIGNVNKYEAVKLTYIETLEEIDEKFEPHLRKGINDTIIFIMDVVDSKTQSGIIIKSNDIAIIGTFWEIETKDWKPIPDNCITLGGDEIIIGQICGNTDWINKTNLLDLMSRVVPTVYNKSKSYANGESCMRECLIQLVKNI